MIDFHWPKNLLTRNFPSWSHIAIVMSGHYSGAIKKSTSCDDELKNIYWKRAYISAAPQVVLTQLQIERNIHWNCYGMWIFVHRHLWQAFNNLIRLKILVPIFECICVFGFATLKQTDVLVSGNCACVFSSVFLFSLKFPWIHFDLLFFFFLSLLLTLSARLCCCCTALDTLHSGKMDA